MAKTTNATIPTILDLDIFLASFCFVDKTNAYYDPPSPFIAEEGRVKVANVKPIPHPFHQGQGREKP